MRGGDNDKLCFSVASDRNREMEREKARRTERQDRLLKVTSVLRKQKMSSVVSAFVQTIKFYNVLPIFSNQLKVESSTLTQFKNAVSPLRPFEAV